MSAAARYASQRALPPYSYVTGRFPHPTSDPAGHSFGHSATRPDRPRSDAWRESSEYCYGIDLFNHGYYWEAHEAWESLWHACGRTSLEADFFKSLIKLAAAGVKAREGRLIGVARHLARASELLASVRARLDTQVENYFGLQLDELAQALANAPAEIEHQRGVDLTADAPVKIVFALRLTPD